MQENKKINWNILSRYKLELYGIIALWIVIYHAFEIKNVSTLKCLPIIGSILNKGNCGVDMFLLLAGIFSYFSLNKDNTDIKKYYFKRIIRLMVPVIIVDWTYWAITLLLGKIEILEFLSKITFLSFWSGKDKMVWYVAWIIILYLIAPMIKKIVDREKKSGVVIAGIILLYYVILYFIKVSSIEFYKNLEIAFTRGPIFILGCYIGRKVYEKKYINSGILAITFLGIFYAISQFKYNKISVYETMRIPYFVISISLTIWTSIILENINIKNYKKLDGILKKIGSMSLEIYLIHIVLRNIFVQTRFYNNAATSSVSNFLMYMLFVGLGSIILALAVSKISNNLAEKINEKVSKKGEKKEIKMEKKINSMLEEDLKIIANTKLDLEKFKNSTIFITGATGLIGSQLTKAFAYCNKKKNLNMRIIIFIRGLKKAQELYGNLLENKEIEYRIGDIRDEKILEDRTFKADYIIHAASITTSKIMISNPVDVIDISLNGTKNMLELAKRDNVKGILYISSMEMYGKIIENEDNVTENNVGILDVLNVRSNYPESKRMCENMCISYLKQYNIPVYIVRLAQTFGAGVLETDNRIFAQFAKSVINEKDIVLHTKGLSEGNYCYTRDMVLGIITILLKGKIGEVYNIANEESHTTIAQMANMVATKIANNKIKVVFETPKENVFGYAKDVKMKLSSAKLRKLGWIPEVGLEEAYRRMIHDMK